jgi:hypothetical protein
MTLLALAVTIMVWHGLHEEARPFAAAIPMLGWLAPLLGTPRQSWFGMLTPLVIFALISVLLAKRPAPAPV